MIHKNDISWSQDDTIRKKFKKNDSIKAKILEIDKEKEKIRLGIKQLEKSPFDYFKDEKLKIGNIITVTVKEILPIREKLFSALCKAKFASGITSILGCSFQFILDPML